MIWRGSWVDWGADGVGALFGGVDGGTNDPVVLRDLVCGECVGAVRGAGGVVADVGGVERDYRDGSGDQHGVDEPGVGEDRGVAVVPAVFDAVLRVEFRGAGEG